MSVKYLKVDDIREMTKDARESEYGKLVSQFQEVIMDDIKTAAKAGLNSVIVEYAQVEPDPGRPLFRFCCGKDIEPVKFGLDAILLFKNNGFSVSIESGPYDEIEHYKVIVNWE
jgi:hypothetical protein